MSIPILNASNFNASSQIVPNVYYQVIPPSSVAPSVPTGVMGFIGTASWGAVGVPILLSNNNDIARNFGGISTASLTDNHDLATAATFALMQQEGNSSVAVFGQRMTDGTDTQASTVLITNSGQYNQYPITISGTIRANDQFDIAIQNSSVTYTVASTDTLATIATNITNLINANTTLTGDGIFAQINSTNPEQILVNFPKTLTPIAPSLTSSTSGATETLTFGSSTGVTTSANLVKLTAKYSGILGNQIVVNVTQGSTASVVNVSIAGWVGKANEVYYNIPVATFQSSLINAINNGVANSTNASTLVVASAVDVGLNLAPAIASYTLAGGTDGRNVTSAQLLGQNSAYPFTGIYAFGSTNPITSVLYVVGLTDLTVLADIVAYTSGQTIMCGFDIAYGLTTAQVIAELATTGVSDRSLLLFKDWYYVNDTTNNINRFVPAGMISLGAIFRTNPQFNSVNRKVYGVLGTERNNPINGNQPYSNNEIGELETAGVIVATNPSLLGNVWALRNSRNSLGALNGSDTSLVEYSRVVNFIIESVNYLLGSFVGKNQSPNAGDPTRLQVREMLNSTFQNWVNDQIIAGFNIVCDSTNNTIETISQHILNISVQVQMQSSILFIDFGLQAGTGVSVQNISIQST